MRYFSLMAGGFSGRIRPWIFAALAAAAFLACNTENAGNEEPRNYFRPMADSTWLGYDSLQVWLDTGDGAAPVLLFAARLASVADLDKLPSDAYGSGKATLVLRGYLDGRVARAENLAYDLARQTILGTTILVPPGAHRTRIDSVAKSGLTISLSPGDTLVTIGDSVPLIAAGWNDAGSLLEAQWDLDGDGEPDLVEHPAAASAVLKAGALFSEPGEYHPSFTLKGSQGGTLRAAATVWVVLDPPEADAGQDFSIAGGSEVVLSGRGEDFLGRIVKQEWQVGDLPFQNAPEGKLAFRFPSAPGELLAVFRVTDDDGLSDLDTARLRVVGADTATHTPMPAGVTLNLGAQGAASYGSTIEIDSQKVWTAARAYANQQDIDLVFLFYGMGLHLEDAVSAKASGIAESINLTNSLDAAKIVPVGMVRVGAEPADQESALATFASSSLIIHGAVIVGGDMFLVRSTGGRLAFLKVISIKGMDKTAEAVVQLKVLTL